jgi:hypothetical protein
MLVYRVKINTLNVLARMTNAIKNRNYHGCYFEKVPITLHLICHNESTDG